jgi:hypothetical protein
MDLPGVFNLCPHLTPQGLYPSGSDLPDESLPEDADLSITFGRSMNTVAHELGRLAMDGPCLSPASTHEVVLVPTIAISNLDGSATSAGTSRDPNSLSGAQCQKCSYRNSFFHFEINIGGSVRQKRSQSSGSILIHLTPCQRTSTIFQYGSQVLSLSLTSMQSASSRQVPTPPS